MEWTKELVQEMANYKKDHTLKETAAKYKLTSRTKFYDLVKKFKVDGVDKTKSALAKKARAGSVTYKDLPTIAPSIPVSYVAVMVPADKLSQVLAVIK